MELSSSFAQTVEKHRVAKGLSRARLAELAGVHQTAVGLVERGKRSPNLETARALAKGLGFPLWTLVKEAEESF